MKMTPADYNKLRETIKIIAEDIPWPYGKRVGTKGLWYVYFLANDDMTSKDDHPVYSIGKKRMVPYDPSWNPYVYLGDKEIETALRKAFKEMGFEIVN